MNTAFSRWMVLYGLFLILAGMTGYLSNPEKAKTALMSGGTFGIISAVLGLLHARGLQWARTAGGGVLVFLAAVFSWRAAAGWIAFSAGKTEKLFAAVLITVMLSATLVSAAAFFRKKI
ncbi:MAG: hypothetical protein FGM27_06710 [Candidatus Omnitrophica bacterium]|nr:hypothetical protein [Candidatus Omnitrophota bacterium]